MSISVGILGVGAYLPEEVRPNDWWPEAAVQSWRARSSHAILEAKLPDEIEVTPNVRRVLHAMSELAADPFRGAIERRVIPKGMLVTEMESRAGADAIARAGIDKRDIDFVLTSTIRPDAIGTNNACRVHMDLDLDDRCLALQTGGACNGFLLQLRVAEQMIRSGDYRMGLVIQSAVISPILDSRDPVSVWFGDGATAAVVGQVPEGKGILAHTTRTDGRYQRVLVIEVPHGHWTDEGRVVAVPAEPRLAREALLLAGDSAAELVGEVLRLANFAPADVEFYAGHQANRWFRRVTQECAGLNNARSIDTFPWAGNLAGANLPLVLLQGEREGLLRDGDLIALYGGGGGMTWSAMAMRWGS